MNPLLICAMLLFTPIVSVASAGNVVTIISTLKNGAPLKGTIKPTYTVQVLFAKPTTSIVILYGTDGTMVADEKAMEGLMNTRGLTPGKVNYNITCPNAHLYANVGLSFLMKIILAVIVLSMVIAIIL
ncbi:hypothetical protein MDAP_001845 [Mitosporidium daphniae]|uniref:Uncharacterized protein n=1 Tax=Mitosporidium daphniae TaxID=1485682 RepID=A0A098VR63_9MICR|nr:uncharacterized protein DI09_7p150 [Mitosporidium daphniae]KGG50236.1 hypothetical protein DI09_7p150 [Mitosporidium daphniae]|eukprot:XP_013236663.1 uncharacterized protein DI09_7p150 [Mitosporidium daphniae]